MNLKEQLLVAAENELTEYSTDLRKIEKLRPKVSLRLGPGERQQLMQELHAELAAGGQWAALVEKQRQTVALPLWGIAGLGMLVGFLGNPLGWGAAVFGTGAAFSVQRWGWQLQARRLLLATLEDIERRARS